MKARVLILTIVGLLLLTTASQAQWPVQIWMDPEFVYSYTNLKGDFYTTWGNALNQPFGPWKGYSSPGFPSGNYWADFYCIDINTTMYGTGHVWDVYPTNLASSYPGVVAQGLTDFGLGWAAHLYNRYAYGLYNVNTPAAMLSRSGLQIAIYEAIYDGAAGYAWNLGGGNFRIGGIGNLSYFYSGTVEEYYAQYVHPYLNDQGQGIAGYWDNGQDLLGPIPEPGTLLLLGIGLAGSGLVILRRKRR